MWSTRGEIVARIAQGQHGRISRRQLHGAGILLDLAPGTPPAALARMCHEAWVRHRCGQDRVEACIRRNPRKPGAAKLRRALGADVTLSDLGDVFERGAGTVADLRPRLRSP